MAETFNYTPTNSSTKSKAPRVKKISFGNGYQQIYGDGINSNLEKWSVTFIVNHSDRCTIEAFFNARAGYEFFNWTSAEVGATQKQYLCPDWTVTPLGNQMYTVAATFEEWAGLV